MAEDGAAVEVDHEACIVSGQCASLAPEVFEVAGDESAIIVLKPRIGSDLVAGAVDAENGCPAGAIYVTVDQG